VAAANSESTKPSARGRGDGKSHTTDKTDKTDMEIKALAKQMRQSIKSLDSKIQKLDESLASPLRSTGLLTMLVAAVVALVAVHTV